MAPPLQRIAWLRGLGQLPQLLAQERRAVCGGGGNRKVGFLMLNQSYWTANPGLVNDAVWMDIMRKVGLVEEKAETESDSDNSDA